MSAARPGRLPDAPPGVVVLRSRRWNVSVRAHGPSVLLALVLWLLAAGVGALALTVGDYPATLADVAAALSGRASPILTHVVVETRLPRVLTALGVGAAFALSGALLQRLARNPLVSPDVIGINAGAAAAAVLTITVLGGSAAQVAFGALAGSLATAALVYLVAYRGGVTSNRLVLAGIGVTAMLSSATAYLLTRAELYEAQRATVWLTGSLAGRDATHALVVGAALAVLLPVGLALGRQLRLLELGEDTARSLGGRVETARVLLLGTSVGLAALATAAAGPIAFVALVAPQITRRLLRERALGLLPAAACGALLVTAADLAARLAFSPTELPVGVVTALLGAPFLLYLLARSNRIGRGG